MMNPADAELQQRTSDYVTYVMDHFSRPEAKEKKTYNSANFALHLGKKELILTYRL